MKTKKKILFNKNHILVEEYTNVTHELSYISQKKDNIDNKYAVTSRYYYLYDDKRKYDTKVIEELKESPLGFYYKQTKTIKTLKDKYQEKIFDRHPILYITNYIFGPKYHYIIKYPYSYNGVNIGTDIRPYDIADTNGIEDHFIFDLKNILDSLFDICKLDKIELKENHCGFSNKKEQYSPYQIGELKKEIYIDIFGFPQGPLSQSNNDKILSHGFDLKDSFRKRKE